MGGSQLAVAALLASLMSAVGSRLQAITGHASRAGAMEGVMPEGRASMAEIDSPTTRVEDGLGDVNRSSQSETATSSSIFHGASFLGGTGQALTLSDRSPVTGGYIHSPHTFTV